MKSKYAAVTSNPNFAEIEKRILKKWSDEGTFEQSVKGNSNYVFFDGPPFANGLPHYGHLLTGFIKDIFARFQTMNGKKVERRFGWDCHGLPAEMAAEKELKISGKIAIEEYGIDKFNDYCKTSVLKYTNEWQDYVNRQARWVDFKNDYKTMDTPYMESVIWAFKSLHEKGLIYESMKVLPYSWACETPVSDFETKMDNAYREKASKALTVTFALADRSSKLPASCSNFKLMIWTTTPWTLPSNLAISVGVDVEYACIEHDESCYIIAKALMHKYEKEIGNNVVAVIKGSDLINLKYHPILPYYAGHENAFKILAGDFVTTEDGTGIVHIAPGFGEDDFNLCKQNGIQLKCPVDNAGRFTSPIEEYKGMQVFEADEPIIKRLKIEGKWIKTEQYMHNYPHCWRTDTPLIYKAVPSWYVEVTAIKDKLIANNQQINWIPAHIKDGLFGKWLENVRDWAISRNRYWGCPIPVWQSDNPKYPHMEVYGSIAELEAAFGVQVKDLHRPFIDTLVRPNPSDPTGKSMLRRVKDVLDCWFESGSMPYAQHHYPFENKEKFESQPSADFIVEYVAQTRGWFYTLLVLSTALFDRPPFYNCICHGVLLGDGGQKLSKRLKNYADPKDVFETIGADALRWFMVSSAVMRGQELIIDKGAKGVKDAVRSAIKPIWNAYNFFVLYANADGIQAELKFQSDNLLDQYISSKCAVMVSTIKTSMDNYDTITACKAVESFLEVLNNWYIRRSRERFWKPQKDQDKISAYNTLYSILHTLCCAAAPLMPMILEEIYQNLTGGLQSLHLVGFPAIEKLGLVRDLEIERHMDRVMDACTATLSIRNDSGMRVRQPLAKATFIGVSSNQALSSNLKDLILDEVNVKEWVDLDASEIEKYASFKLQIKFPVLGKRLPTKVKDIIAAQKQGQWTYNQGEIEIIGIKLEPQEYEMLLEAKPEYQGRIAPLPTNDALVLLDLELTLELKLEGIARDVVRAVQQLRKDAGFDITDRINIVVQTEDQGVIHALKEWSGYINEQTLCNELSLQADNSFIGTPLELDGKKLQIEIKRA